MQDASILPALQDRYAGLLGELKTCDERAEEIKVALVHMEAVIKLYRADWTGSDVAPRRPPYANRYVKVGRGTQTALDVLREAAEPLTVREIVVRVMEKLEIPVTATAVKSLDSTLRYTLAKRIGNGVVCEGVPKRWRVS